MQTCKHVSIRLRAQCMASNCGGWTLQELCIDSDVGLAGPVSEVKQSLFLVVLLGQYYQVLVCFNAFECVFNLE